MSSYPKKYDWEFTYDGIPYRLTCKDKMYWDTYKFKPTDVKVLDPELKGEPLRHTRERIARSLNLELK